MNSRNYSKPWLLALANLKLLEAAERHPFGTANCGVLFFLEMSGDVPYVDAKMFPDL